MRAHLGESAGGRRAPGTPGAPAACGGPAVLGRDPDAGQSGQRDRCPGRTRPQLRRSAAGTAETGRDRSGWLPRPFPIVSPQTKLITRATQRPRGGPAAELGAVGGVPGRTARLTGAWSGERGRLLPPGVRPRPAALLAGPRPALRRPPGLAGPEAGEAAWAPAAALASVRPQPRRSRRSRAATDRHPPAARLRRKEAAGGRGTAGQGEGTPSPRELKLS